MAAMQRGRRRDALTFDSKHCFSSVLLEARKASPLTQNQVGEKIGVSGPMVGKYEEADGNATAPEPATAIKLARLFNQDPGKWALLAMIQKTANGDPVDDDALTVLLQMLNGHNNSPHEATTSRTDGILTLCDFPKRFRPVAVIVGDKREKDPVNIGDLFAFSASTMDDRWLAKLQLPADTEKYSDKVFARGVADEKWLKSTFGKRHLLTIGSPASNLFSRTYNRRFLYRFAILRPTEERWNNIVQTEYRNLSSPADLMQFGEKWKDDLQQYMRMFKQPGFVDFNYRHLKLCFDPGYQQDFAVISLGRNPFADPDDPYFSIIVAGIHLPGTAQALKFLANPTNFTNHPFGGVLEIAVPSKQFDPKSVEWYEKIEKSDCQWHKAGDSTLGYTPGSFRKRLESLRGELDKLEYIDFPLDKDELDDHLRLLEILGCTSEPGDASDGLDETIPMAS